MLAPTHSIFGMFLSMIVLALFGVKMSLHWTIMLFAILGAIAPDIDHTSSFIGRIFHVISRRIEEKFGHRMVTHSIIGWGIATIGIAIVLAILFFFGLKAWPSGIYNWRWAAAFSIGYLSHLMLDMLNFRGVPLFWPEKARFVVFKNPKFRFHSGSKVETIFAIIFILCIFLALPLTKYGMSSSIRWMLATSGSAIEEYKDNDKVTLAEFSGYFTATKQPVTKGRAEILGIENRRLIILYQGMVYTMSDGINADILADKVRVKKTSRPLNIVKKDFEEKSKDYLISQIPEGALVSGTVYLPKGLKLDLPDFAGGLERLKQSGNQLVLTFANKEMIRKLDFNAQYSLEIEKDGAGLAGLYSRKKKILSRMKSLNGSDGLTDLGREILLSEEAREKNELESVELQAQLNDVQVKINEIQLRMKTRKPVFSGSVYIRY